MLGDGGLHLLHIVELAVGAGDVGKFVAHEPHLVERATLEHGHDALMLFATALAQFAHLAQNGHFGVHLHQAEVGERRCHRGGVGIIGINDEVIVHGFGELRTVVRRHIILQSLADAFGSNPKVQAHSYGGKHIVEVVAANEVRGH